MHTPDAEKAVLGCCLLSNEACTEVCTALVAEDFEYEIHRHIYAAISFLHANNTPVDLITVSDRLESQGLAEATGDVTYLSDLCRLVPSPTRAVEYIQIITQRSTRRRLQSLLTAQIQASTANADPDEIVAALTEGITNLQPRKDSSFVSAEEAVNLMLDYINTKDLPSVKTGFTELDRRTGGLRGGELILLAGRPGMGKTACAQSMALKMALNEHRVVFLECEMSPADLMMRWASALSQVPLGMIRNKDIVTDSRELEMDKVIHAASRISGLPLNIVDASGWTVSRIRGKLLQEQRKAPISAVFIDYLQLLLPEKTGGNTNDAVADQSKRLKMLARELDVPIILLSQLNRSVESREDKRPRMSDLRDSGAIEQDADAVLLLYRGHVYDEEVPADRAELNIAKLRNGEPGTISLRWKGATTSYHNP